MDESSQISRDYPNINLNFNSKSEDENTADQQQQKQTEQVGLSEQASNSINHIQIRALIATKDAGLLIGVGGRTAQFIRDQTGVRIRVGDPVPYAVDRLLTVTASGYDQLAAAFQIVTAKILEHRANLREQWRQQGKRIMPQRAETGRHQLVAEGQMELRLLIPHHQMGAVIGRAGHQIRQLQEESGCRVAAGEQMLPQSTDRCVSCIGDDKQVAVAVSRIAQILQDNGGTSRATGHVPYRPQPVDQHRSSARSSGQGRGGGGRRRNTDSTGGSSCNNNNQNSVTSLEDDSVHRTIKVPSEMAGALIGRGGITIREMRTKSGAGIHIASEEADSRERVVSVKGTSEQIQTALRLIYQLIDIEKSLNQQKEQLTQLSNTDESATAAKLQEMDKPAQLQDQLHQLAFQDTKNKSTA